MGAAGCAVVVMIVALGGVWWWTTHARGPKTPGGAPVATVREADDPLAALRAAKSDAEMQAAVAQVLCTGLSLGLSDESGRQLNAHVDENAVSLTPAGLAAQAGLALRGHGRTLASLAEFLAGAGVELAATGRTISTEDLLPEVQRYVDWSCAHRGDARSMLGLLLSSGTDFAPPQNAMRLTGNTVVSNLAGLLLVADILLGVEPTPHHPTVLPLATPAWGAEEQAAALSRLKGLITRIEPQLARHNLEVPEAVRVLIGAYEACDRLSVRVMWPYVGQDVVTPDDTLASLAFSRSGDQVPCSVVTVLEPDQAVLRGVPLTYDAAITSVDKEFVRFTQDPDRYVARCGREAPLHPDCDAVLLPAGGPEEGGALSGLWVGQSGLGHRARLGTSSEQNPAVNFGLLCTQLDNRQQRLGFLGVEADVQLKLLAEIGLRFRRRVGVEGLVFEDFEDFEALLVELRPGLGETTLVFEPAADDSVPVRSARLTGVLYPEPNNDEPPIADLTLDFAPPQVTVTIVPRASASGINLSQWPRLELHGALAEEHGWGYLVFAAEASLPVPGSDASAPIKLSGTIEPTYPRLLDDEQLNFKDLPHAAALGADETDPQRFYYAFGSLTFSNEMLWQAAE
ncbi:MAG: hypothetical protein AB7Y46_15285 [Armatimonadota bacterium]